jgi:hypothetical protein
MGSGESLPFDSFARATSGQVVWTYLNRWIDNDERERRVHVRCLGKLDEILCEVCSEPVSLIEQDPRYRDKLKDKVYNPSEDFERQIELTPEEAEAKTEMIADLFTSSGIEVHENTRTVESVEQI